MSETPSIAIALKKWEGANIYILVPSQNLHFYMHDPPVGGQVASTSPSHYLTNNVPLSTNA